MQEIGVSESEFRKVGIPLYAEPTPLTFMPERPWWALLNRVSRREGVVDIGLLAGRSVPFSEIQSMLPQLGGCGCLQDLLVRFCSITPMQSTAARFELAYTHNGVWLRDVGKSLLEDSAACAQLRLFRILGMIQIVQKVLGKNWRPRQVLLPFSNLAGLEDSELLGAERVHFDQPYGAIAIPLHCLSTKLRSPSRNGDFSSTMNQVRQMTGPPVEFIESLRTLITYYLNDEALSLEYVAGSCDMSVRTLQRRLGQRGLSFSELRQQSRHERALQLLTSEDASLAEVSYLLGYSDYSKFSRAFQRRTGHTPRQFRESEKFNEI